VRFDDQALTQIRRAAGHRTPRATMMDGRSARVVGARGQRGASGTRAIIWPYSAEFAVSDLLRSFRDELSLGATWGMSNKKVYQMDPGNTKTTGDRSETASGNADSGPRAAEHVHWSKTGMPYRISVGA